MLRISAAILTFSSIVSAGLGLLRDRLLASHFGAGEMLDAYFAAFRIPDLLYAMLIMGGLNSVLLPLLARRFHEEREEAWKFVSNLLNVLLLCFTGFALVLFFFTSLLIHVVAPGFSPESKDLTISLARFMMLSPVLFSLSAVCSGVLQYFQRTVAFALAPILYNGGIILGIIFLAPFFGIWGVAFGVVGGAVLHFFSQAGFMYATGFRWKPVFSLRDRNLYEMVKLGIPRTIGGGLYQINLVALTALSSLFGSGSLVVFNFANNIQSMPATIIGVSFALAVFPILSKASAQGDMKAFSQSFVATFRHIIWLVLPLSVVLLVFGFQVSYILFGVGRFDAESARLTGSALTIFASSLVFQALLPLFMRGFFALSDTKTPLITGAISMVITLSMAWGLAIAFQGPLGGVVRQMFQIREFTDIRLLSLPIAISLGSMLHVIFLSVLLLKKEKNIESAMLGAFAIKMVGIGAIIAVTLLGVARMMSFVVDVGTFSGLFFQTACSVMAGFGIFILSSFLLGISEVQGIGILLRKAFYGR